VFALCLFGLALPSQALGWASQGHQAIAEAALARILVGGHSTTLPPGKLAVASTWPDEIRGLKGPGLPPFGWDADDVEEAKGFNAVHASNAKWHFVNLPLGAPGYPKAADAVPSAPGAASVGGWIVSRTHPMRWAPTSTTSWVIPG
jgi:hypothetical protein